MSTVHGTCIMKAMAVPVLRGMHAWLHACMPHVGPCHPPTTKTSCVQLSRDTLPCQQGSYTPYGTRWCGTVPMCTSPPTTTQTKNKPQRHPALAKPNQA